MDALRFATTFVRHPRATGSLVPSSDALARAIVRHAEIGPGDVVLECGAGTGAFTKELVRRNQSNPIVAFEQNSELAARVRARFPGVQVVAESVERVPELLPEMGISRVDRVVSGLPWANWDEPLQARLMDSITALLSPHARFVTFHYTHSSWLGRAAVTRRLLHERFAEVRDTPAVLWNLPPAFVRTASRPKRM